MMVNAVTMDLAEALRMKTLLDEVLVEGVDEGTLRITQTNESGIGLSTLVGVRRGDVETLVDVTNFSKW